MKRILLIVTLLFSMVCSPQENRTDKINVVVSILPLAEFAEKIGGDKINVSVMVPPGASPHTYEPTPGQLVEVNKAKMYVKVGSSIEFELVWLNKILSTNKDIFVIDASADIEFAKIKHNEYPDELDPHIWLSFKNAKIMVENICKGLVSIDTQNKNYYEAQKEKYFEELNKLDSEIEQMLSKKTNRRFMVYHPSWGYFAKDYNLEQIPVEAEGKEPTAKGIQYLIEQAKKHNIKVIFASPQFNTESAEVIAREIRGHVVLMDPLEKDYVTNMKKVAQVLAGTME